jgi:pimeloyl-ACP methyl ester carboxylesterase
LTTKQVRVDGADIDYTDTGTGPTIVFVHGVYVTGALWDDVVGELGDGFRCVTPTWPLGAHSTATGDADLGAGAAARRIVHFLEALDLRDVTVVANDTGGGLVLAALGDTTLDTSRIGRLILTNCDSYEHFPPGSFAQIVRLCRLSSALGGAILRLLATGPGQGFFLKAVCRHAPAPARRRAIFGAFATSTAARRDAVRVTASLDPALTLRAAPAIEAFDKPVTLAWGTDDQLFPLDAPLHPAYQRLLKEGGEPGARGFAALHALQLRPTARHAHQGRWRLPDDARDGCRHHQPRLDAPRHRRATRLGAGRVVVRGWSSSLAFVARLRDVQAA